MQIIIQSKDLALALRNVALRLSGILDQRLLSASNHLWTSAKQYLSYSSTKNYLWRQIQFIMCVRSKVTPRVCGLAAGHLFLVFPINIVFFIFTMTISIKLGSIISLINSQDWWAVCDKKKVKRGVPFHCKNSYVYVINMIVLN